MAVCRSGFARHVQTSGCARKLVTRHSTRGYRFRDACATSNMCETCDVVTGWIVAADVEGSDCQSRPGRGLCEEPVRTDCSTPSPPSIALSIIALDVVWSPIAHPFVNLCTQCVKRMSCDSLRVFPIGLVVDVQAPLPCFGSWHRNFESRCCVFGLHWDVFLAWTWTLVTHPRTFFTSVGASSVRQF